MTRLPALLLLLAVALTALSTPRSEAVIPAVGTPVSIRTVESAQPQSGAPNGLQTGPGDSRTREVPAAESPQDQPSYRVGAPHSEPLREAGANHSGGVAVKVPAGAVASPGYSACPSPCFVDLRFVVRSGIASTYGRGWSEWWVALPDGPGWRFTVCGAGGCRTLVSTDAGPDRAMQRKGRIVDLPPGAFAFVCGVPASFGLCQVSVTVLGRAK